MKTRNAIILYLIGMFFAVGGYFNRSILIAGWVVFSVIAIIGLVFNIT